MKFELNEYKRQLTDEEIIQDIKVTAERLEKEYLSLSEYKKMVSFRNPLFKIILELGQML